MPDMTTPLAGLAAMSSAQAARDQPAEACWQRHCGRDALERMKRKASSS